MLLIVHSARLVAFEWEPIWVVAAGVPLGALVTVAGTVLLSKRRESGSIQTSDAATLWAAADKLLERVTMDNSVLREENVKLRERVAILEKEVARLSKIVDGHE